MNASTLKNAPAATALTVADPAHIDLLEAMTARFHQGEGVQLPAAHRKSALANLLASPGQGCILLVEHCATSQVCGYAILAYGLSLEFGGRDAFLDEFYIDEQFRGRGIGKAALEAICQWAREAGLAAVHLEVEKANTSAKALYANLGFEDREHYHLMSLRIAVPKDR